MAQRNVPNNELAALAQQKYKATPLENRPRAFNIPTARVDEFNADVQKLKQGATLNSVLGIAPQTGTWAEKAGLGEMPHPGLNTSPRAAYWKGLASGTAAGLLDYVQGAASNLNMLGSAYDTVKQAITGEKPDTPTTLVQQPQTTVGTIGRYAPLVAAGVEGLIANPAAMIMGTGGAAVATPVVKLGTQAALERAGVSEPRAEAIGDITGTLAGLTAGNKLNKAFTPGNAASQSEIDALKFAREQNIPLDVATASRNKAANVVQRAAGYTIPGGEVSKAEQHAQQEALTSAGQRVAGDVYRAPVSEEEAGRHVTNAMQGIIDEAHSTANRWYDKFRELTAKYDATADISAAKQNLQVMYDRLTRQMPIGQQEMSAPLKAIRNILDSPDNVPLDVLDQDLGVLKGIAKSSRLSELRDASQGAMASVVNQLERSLQAGMRAIPQRADIAEALANGRAATIAKWETDALREQLGDRAVNALRGALSGSDTNIETLTDIVNRAPQTRNVMGRALIDRVLSTGRSGFNQWNKLGNSTKGLLFTPDQVRGMNALFKLQQMIAENPNPSGTSYAAGALAALGMSGGKLDPMALLGEQLSGGVLAKIMYNPKAADYFARSVIQGAGAGAKSQAATKSALGLLSTALAAANVLNDAESE